DLNSLCDVVGLRRNCAGYLRILGVHEPDKVNRAQGVQVRRSGGPRLGEEVIQLAHSFNALRLSRADTVLAAFERPIHRLPTRGKSPQPTGRIRVPGVLGCSRTRDRWPEYRPRIRTARSATGTVRRIPPARPLAKQGSFVRGGIESGRSRGAETRHIAD